ncbi:MULTISPECIES: SDR family oxidoreductase [Actinomadura]|uniref:SDR family oxidoreductase n=1 Tax=Actinomadura yumaensis TaxID=111807 RepID=A0ABW2CIE2_9ACTN|nr:SDR family oxidoreductase [Actinomadura sp. J1-007]MWK37128.1 SDR family oxidoreductase [Actinomadura sp. J1-007]
MDLQLSDKVYLVTGASSGIGAASVRLLAAAAKTALLSVSKPLSVEFAPFGVRSNVVSPGPTRTALFDAPGGFAEQLVERYGMSPDEAVDHFIRAERTVAPLLADGLPAQESAPAS